MVKFRQMMCLVVGALLCLAACKDDEETKVPDLPEDGDFRYELSLYEGIDNYEVSFTGIFKSQVKSVRNPMGWLEVTSSLEGEVFGIQVELLKPIPANFRSDSVEINLEDGHRIWLVTVLYEELQPSGDNSGDYDAFNQEWWKQQSIAFKSTVEVNGERRVTTEQIQLPWADQATSNLPLEAYDAVDAGSGWVMALNMFDAERDGWAASQPYFVLYNKYAGTARVFYYQRERPLTAGEFSFELSPLGQSVPYYLFHNLQFAIPSNHLEMNTGDFKQFITPYQLSPALSQGWTAFDIDMSHYTPGGDKGMNKNDRMNLNGSTLTSLDIVMQGNMKGESSGDIEMRSTGSMSSANGLNYIDQFNSGTGRIGNILEAFATGNYLKGLFFGGLSLYNVGKALTGNAVDKYESTGKSSGSVNMNFSGTIDLAGKITGNRSSVITPIDFRYQSFVKDDVFGTGVWSLRQDPVVYVLADELLADTDLWACTVQKDYYGYGAENPADDNLRMVNFLDPRSIVIDLNTKVYKEVSNVEVFYNYGVYPNLQHGHTASYRSRLAGLKTEAPALVDRKQVGEGKRFTSWDWEKGMNIHENYTEDDKFNDGNPKGRKFYAQAGADYRYWGKAANEEPENSLNFFVENPLVCIPTTFDQETGVGKVYDPVIPDFVVNVLVTFNYKDDNGKVGKGMFSKRFIPQVKLLNSTDLEGKQAELDAYADAVENGGVQQTLGNGLQVRHKDTGKAAKRMADILEFIIKDK